MSGLKEQRTRIGSIKSTRQVTSAMKMVSAAKLKRAQDTVIHFRPYARNFEKIMNTAVSGSENLEKLIYTAPREPRKVLLVLISSNRGLCGGFNSSIAHFAYELVQKEYSRQLADQNLRFLTIGKQGERFLKNHRMTITGNKNELYDLLNFTTASEVAEELISQFRKGEVDRIELIYNEFINTAQYVQRRETFLPVMLTSGVPLTGDIIYEPSQSEILEKMIPMALKIEFYKALILSFAAEHGARMTAMHQATDNATDLLSELSLQYNKARQAAITNEILEITGGAEAQRK